MPEYVKLNPENTIGGDEIFKVQDVKQFDDGIGLLIDKITTHMHTKYFLPATKHEYESYIIKIKVNEQ